MKRTLLVALAALAAGLFAAPMAQAQYGGGGIDPGGSVDTGADQKPAPYQPEDSTPSKREDKTCPSVAILGDADHATVFDGKGRDVTNIAYQTSLEKPKVECKHRKGQQLNITVTTTISTELGLAAETHEIEVPYFVAIVDPEDMVVTKEQRTALVKVEGGNRAGSVTIENPTIKLSLEEDTIGADLQVLIGLQLSEDQLGYNRTGH